jgi:transglutaminase-like putative cysteine protease
MNYRIVHRTTYKYKYPVSVGNHVACLTPRSLPDHQLKRSELHIQPTPATRTERVDYFGNLLYFFTVQEPHTELVVEARSEVTINGLSRPWPQQSLAWEEVARALPNDQSPAGLDAYQFGFESPRIRVRPERPMLCSLLRPAGRCRNRSWISPHASTRIFDSIQK